MDFARRIGRTAHMRMVQATFLVLDGLMCNALGELCISSDDEIDIRPDTLRAWLHARQK